MVIFSLSSVLISSYICNTNHGHRKGGKGALAPWILKIFAKKVCFLSFEWEKTNFITFSPLEKFWKNPLVAPWKKSFRRP